MSFLSPPFGYALFYLGGVDPLEFQVTEIFKAVMPFLFLKVIGLTRCMSADHHLAAQTDLRLTR